jgi:hypothetical protein
MSQFVDGQGQGLYLGLEPRACVRKKHAGRGDEMPSTIGRWSAAVVPAGDVGMRMHGRARK